MTNEITTRNITFTNKGLQKATDKMLKIGTTMSRCAFEAAFIIAEVAESKCYLDDGFKNVHEWTAATFGIEKSASYGMLKIGRDYTAKVIEGGKVKGYRSNLTATDEDDYSTSQIMKMLPIPREEIETVIEAEEITPADSCREIEAKIKHYKQKDAPETTDDETNEAIEVEATEKEEDVFTLPRSLVMEIFKEISKSKTKKAQEITTTLADILGV